MGGTGAEMEGWYRTSGSLAWATGVMLGWYLTCGKAGGLTAPVRRRLRRRRRRRRGGWDEEDGALSTMLGCSLY